MGQNFSAFSFHVGFHPCSLLYWKHLPRKATEGASGRLGGRHDRSSARAHPSPAFSPCFLVISAFSQMVHLMLGLPGPGPLKWQARASAWVTDPMPFSPLQGLRSSKCSLSCLNCPFSPFLMVYFHQRTMS